MMLKKELLAELNPRERIGFAELASSVLRCLLRSQLNDTNGGEIGVSSLIDTWIIVRELEDETSKRRIRGLYIVKSRGSGHSSDVHKLVLSDDGINLIPMDNVGTAGPNKKKNPSESVSENPKLIKKDKGT